MAIRAGQADIIMDAQGPGTAAAETREAHIKRVLISIRNVNRGESEKERNTQRPGNGFAVKQGQDSQKITDRYCGGLDSGYLRFNRLGYFFSSPVFEDGG